MSKEEFALVAEKFMDTVYRVAFKEKYRYGLMEIRQMQP